MGGGRPKADDEDETAVYVSPPPPSMTSLTTLQSSVAILQQASQQASNTEWGLTQLTLSTLSPQILIVYVGLQSGSWCSRCLTHTLTLSYCCCHTFEQYTTRAIGVKRGQVWLYPRTIATEGHLIYTQI